MKIKDTHDLGGTGPVASAPDPQARTVSEPKSRPRALAAWLTLLVCLVVASPGMLIGLRQADVVNPHEAQTLAGHIHQWRHTGEHKDTTGQSLGDGRVSLATVDTAPGTFWLQAALWDFTGESISEPRSLVLVARVGSVVMGLLLVASVYWAAHSIGGPQPGLLAGLVCATCPLLAYYGRLSTGAIHAAAWVGLCMASALWATRPLRPLPHILRQATGWGLSGVFLGMAVLTLGPGAVWYAVVPMVVVLILCPHRFGHLLGLVASLLISALMVLPWVASSHAQDLSFWGRWLQGLSPGFHAGVVSQGLLALAVALGPWCFWVIGALAQPFSTSSKGTRTRLFVGWAWFVTVMVILMFDPNAGAPGRGLLVLPAGAVFLGQLFSLYSDLAAGSRTVRLWRLLSWPYAVALGVGAVTLPVLLINQDLWVSQGWLEQPLGGSLPLAIGAGVVLLLLSVIGIRWVVRDYPNRAVYSWSAWSSALIWTLAVVYAYGPAARSTVRLDAQRVASITSDEPIYWLTSSVTPTWPNPAWLIYCDRFAGSISSERAQALASNGDAAWVLRQVDAAPTNDSAKIAASLRNSGLELVRYGAN